MLAYLLSLALTLVPTQEPGDPPAAAIQSLDQQLEAFDRLRRLRAPSSEKIACLHAIGARGDRGGVDALMRLLGRLEGELAQAAVHGIALNGTPYANLKLRMLARDRTHPEVRRQACLDLARGTHDDLLFLRDKRLPKEKDLLIRGELLRNLIDREVEGLDQVVLKAARSRDNLYASVGVYGIGKLRLTKGLRLVEGCLNDPDLQLRLASMRALADFGGAESYRTLLRAYARPKNLALRPDIEKLLHQATRPTEIEVLIEEGLDDSNEEVVGACAAAVASAAAEHPELCTSALLSLLEHRTPAIRDFAELRGKTLGTSLGYVYADDLMQAFAAGEIRREDTRDLASRVQMLKRSRLDAAVDMRRPLLYLTRQHPELGLSVSPLVLQSYRMHCIYGGQLPVPVESMDRVLDEMVRDGSIGRLLENSLQAPQEP